MLLRVAVGWHFLYEGLWKIDSHRKGINKWSAEGYLANSSGPFRAWFRSHLDDPDGLERLEPAGAVGRWEQALAEMDRRYRLNDDQQTSAQTKIRELEQGKEAFFGGPATKAKLAAYREEIQQIIADESGEPKFVREHAKDRRKELARVRDALLATVDGWTKTLREHATAELTPEQIARDSTERLGGLAGWLGLPFKLEWPERQIDQDNLVTMLGLTICGGLLVLGLFSRLAALGAAVLVGMFYVCNPAPPLGGDLPGDPGHYLYVNKEMIECFAALVLATIPSGRWLGLDALIRGLITRRISGWIFGLPDDAIVKTKS